MAGVGITGIFALVLLTASSALCQPFDKPNPANSLPDAPSVQTSTTTEMFRAFLDTPGLPVDTRNSVNPEWHFDPGHFEYEGVDVQSEPENSAGRIRLFASGHSYHASAGNGLLGRTIHAASSMVITHDDNGKTRLNTPYLLTVLTSAVAHSAYRPYWKRSVSQPFSDFGSTVGSDAGMNVFHEFEPGILQLVKTHEPKFVSRIEGHIGRR
jgi:hypothetical protein